MNSFKITILAAAALSISAVSSVPASAGMASNDLKVPVERGHGFQRKLQ